VPRILAGHPTSLAHPAGYLKEPPVNRRFDTTSGRSGSPSAH
jgi:hypothetical protein